MRRKAGEPAPVVCWRCGARYAPRPGRRCSICIIRAVEDRTGMFREFPDDPGYQETPSQGEGVPMV